VTTTTADLVSEVLASDRRDYRRPAVPTVDALAREFVATGAYPYNDDVKAFILARINAPDASTEPDFERKLDTQIYLASKTRHVREMSERADAARADGYVPITDLEPTRTTRIKLHGREGVYRMRPANNAMGDWVLLPKGARTHGISLHGLRMAHIAFETAVVAQTTEMNGPAPWFFTTA
jgi:hypothetical protein